MAWDLRGNMQDEIDRALMTSRLGPQQIRELYPRYPYSRNKPIVQEGQYDELTKSFQQGGATSAAQGTGGRSGSTASGTTGSASRASSRGSTTSSTTSPRPSA